MNVRIIGYSSDQEPAYAIRGFVPRTKKENRAIKQDKLFQLNENGLEEWFVYLVDGQKRYYKLAQDIFELSKHHKEVKFLGIGGHPKDSLQPDKSVLKSMRRQANNFCCYCNVRLTTAKFNRPQSGTDRTKDHITPKNRGGKKTLPCCYACNQEKGGLMLHSYIQMLCLNYNDAEPGTPEFDLLKIKIDNANKIAKSLNIG